MNISEYPNILNTLEMLGFAVLSTQPTYPNSLNILEMLGYFVPKGYANEAQPNLHIPTYEDPRCWVSRLNPTYGD